VTPREHDGVATDGEYVEALVAIGRRAGLDRVGVAPAEPFDETRAALEERKAAGLHGGMAFTYRNPTRSTDPRRTLPSARSIVVGARAYPSELPPPPRGGPSGRVARYATVDHYAELRHGLEAVASRLVGDGWKARLVLDDNALVDRAAAHRAGLGWYGKNSNLLVPGSGSWFVLGSVLTDADLPANRDPVPDGCGSCRRCIDGCPTGAIVAPGVVDARRCLAWLVQAEGDFPEELRPALGDRIYGCDDCQEVCPPNRGAARRPNGGSPADAGAWVSLLEVLSVDDDTLLARHGRWYIPRRDPRYLRRNALVALGNVGRPDDPAVVATLRRYLESSDDLLRRHARWAADRLGIAA
jgi:epoxyqueuosine reductase